MDATALKLLAGLTLIVTGLGGLWLLRGGSAAASAAASGAAPKPAPPRPLPEADRLLGAYRGRLRAIQERTRFSAPSFERDCMQLMRRVAAHPLGGEPANRDSIGLLLDQTYHALGYRQSILLPPNVAAEDIEPRSFRWTFGVIVASMLSGLRPINAFASGVAADDLQALLQPWLDTDTLQWLLQDDLLVGQLRAFFASASGTTVFHRLVADGRKAALGQAQPAQEAVPAALAVSAVSAVSAKPVAPAALVAQVQQPSRSNDIAPPLTEKLSAEAAATAIEPVPDTVEAATPAIAAPPLSGTALANDFMQWLSGGVAEQTIAVNAPGAGVHFVADGMVLAAPGIFQEYAAQRSTSVATDVVAFGKLAQKAVCAEGWHLRGPQDASMHRFKVAGDDKSAVALKGLVIPRPQRFVASVPPPNAALSRLM
ncbi:MAG: DNA-binding domain-containing protein [Rhizobacter sp.]